jgi:hypothetical protein
MAVQPVPASDGDQQGAAVQAPAETGAARPPAERFFAHLETALPAAYDFAFRLLRSAQSAEQTIETGLRAMLRSPDDCLASEGRYLARLCAEIYLIAEGAADAGSAELDRLQRLSGTAAAPPDLGALIWDAARQLPLQEYAALHLQSRLHWPREAVAEGLGLTSAYTFVLLGRARRHFEEAFSSALLLREQPSNCPAIEEIRTQGATGQDPSDLQARVVAHLSSGCPICQSALARAGDIGTMLTLLAPVTPPPGLADHLRERLADRVDAFDELVRAGSAAGAGTAAAALAGSSTGTEPGLTPSRWERSRQWLDDHHLRVPLLAGGAAVLVIAAVLAIVAVGQQAARQPAAAPVTEVAAVTTSPDEAEGGAIGRASTPTTGRLPEITFSTPAEQSTGQPPQSTAAQEQPGASQPVPRLTATPQNRVAPGPVVILNPLPTDQARSPSAPPPAVQAAGPAQPDAAAPATNVPPTATPAPTLPPPRLVVSRQALTFARNETTKTVTLTNAGAGQIRWSAEPQQVWIVVSPQAGTVGGTSIDLQVFVDPKLHGPGPQTGSITITSNAGNAVISITSE